MSSFKRYVKNIYPIAGLRWDDGSGIGEEFGVLVNQRKIDTDTQRRTIADQQVMVRWDNFRDTLKEQMGAEANDGVNLGTADPEAVQVFKEKVGEDLTFRSLRGSATIEIVDTGEVLVFATLPQTLTQGVVTRAEFQRPATPTQGEVFFNTDTRKQEIWTGLAWKVFKYE